MWQPIETVPLQSYEDYNLIKPPIRILLYYPPVLPKDNTYSIVGVYEGKAHYAKDGRIIYKCSHVVGVGITDFKPTEGISMNINCIPTHWMPLPEAPKDS